MPLVLRDCLPARMHSHLWVWAGINRSICPPHSGAEVAVQEGREGQRGGTVAGGSGTGQTTARRPRAGRQLPATPQGTYRIRQLRKAVAKHAKTVQDVVCALTNLRSIPNAAPFGFYHGTATGGVPVVVLTLTAEHSVGAGQADGGGHRHAAAEEAGAVPGGGRSAAACARQGRRWRKHSTAAR